MWILILTILSSSSTSGRGVSVAMHEFNSQEACLEAGNAFNQRIINGVFFSHQGRGVYDVLPDALCVYKGRK